MNLCLNSRDAMPAGGVLRVSTSQESGVKGQKSGEAASSLTPVSCLLTPDSGWVRLSVEDSGQGMSEEVRARIFEPFFSTREGGTGLGLAVVGQIVESYGGRIEVFSQPGQGTRFEVS
jgi:signal transduction histidine kinase